MTSTVLDFNSALTQDRLEEVLKRRTVDVEDIRARLHGSSESFVRWLFSGRALVARGEARIGDISGTPGGSLRVSLAGSSAGLWSDYATGEHGDLISLYMAYMGYSQQHFGHALKEIAAEFLGDSIEVQRPVWQESAARRIEKKAVELGTKPRADMLELGLKVADWKYHDLHGNIIASVARYEPEGQDKTYRPFCFKLEDGKPVWRMGAPPLRPLYRLPEIVTCQTVILTEGEKCAQALAELGIDATTAMQGAHAPVEKTDWSPIQGKTVIIWPDNDAPGFEYARKVADHLRAIGCTVNLVQIPSGKPDKWDAADCIEEGGDAREVIRTAQESKAPVRFPIYAWQELANLPPPRWAIEGFIPEGGFIGIYGPSGHFKSFVVVDIAACAAIGRDWHGARVNKGPVLYVVAEGARGFRKRLTAWQQTKAPVTSFYVLPAAPMFPDDLQAIEAAIRGMPEKPALIILDTLARTFRGNENDAEDMADWIRSATWLQNTFQATILFIHHTGKDLEKKDRGHTSLRAAADTMIRVQKKGEHGVTIEVDKQKDDEELTIELRTVSVEIGTDEATNKPITSLVLVKDEGGLTSSDETDKPEKAKTQGLGVTQETILRLLRKHGNLGFQRLLLLSGIDKGTLGRALRALADRDLIARDGATESAQWGLINGK